MKIIVIGGGAAGLAAAISAARCGAQVHILEKNSKPGKKLLSTGGGRCNFTNMRLSAANYYDCNKAFISSLLDRLGPNEIIDFFYGLGLACVIRNGHAYPASEEAGSLVRALTSACESLGVKLHNNCTVSDIEKSGDKFLVKTEGYNYEADKVILACGGCAAPATGSTGDGYALAEKFGHSISALSPALSGILINDKLTKASGVRTNVRISISDNVGGPLCDLTGEIQINSNGISGIPVMTLSHYVSEGAADIRIDFIPQLEIAQLEAFISAGGNTYGLLPEKLARVLFDECPAKLKNYSIKAQGLGDFAAAHVTKGGISLNEIDAATMGSKLCPGLYFAGELMDVDGWCGGYNLHFAWSSGIIAGYSSAAGRSYEKTGLSFETLSMIENFEIGNRRG